MEVFLHQWTHKFRRYKYGLSVVVNPQQVICPVSWGSHNMEIFLTCWRLKGIPYEQHLDHTLFGHTRSWQGLEENASDPKMRGQAKNQNIPLSYLMGRAPKMAIYPILFYSVLAIHYQMLVISVGWPLGFVVQQVPAFYNLSDVVEASIWYINMLFGIKTLPSEILEKKLPTHCRNFPLSKHLGWRFQITCSKISFKHCF